MYIQSTLATTLTKSNRCKQAIQRVLLIPSVRIAAKKSSYCIIIVSPYLYRASKSDSARGINSLTIGYDMYL